MIVAFCLASFLTPAVASAGDEQAAPGQPAGEDPFVWLMGRWKGREETRWGLKWSEPNGLRRPRKWKDSEAALNLRLELNLTTTAAGPTGTLDAIAADGKKTTVVTLAIARTDGDCILTWQEGGVSYHFGFEGSGGSYRLAPGDIERGSAQRRIRFGRKVGSRKRASSARRPPPYPIIIEFWMLDGKLTLRRVQGPQHGAAIDQQYDFSRP